jgi:hypothetical protein
MQGPKHHSVRHVTPGSFEGVQHFYPRALGADPHPLVRYFIALGNERIGDRFCHLHPEADPAAVRGALARTPAHFRWGGADLFCTTNEDGIRRIIVVETNSSPSGQKSMPQGELQQAGYRSLLGGTMLPYLDGPGLPDGALAVLYDKNIMEASGYAATLADMTEQPVFLVPCFAQQPEPFTRFTADRVLEVRHGGAWHPIRAALRYVTQQPWARIPVVTRTLLVNPVLACLAGGRNKLLAAKAYGAHNQRLAGTGLSVRTPETIWDVAKGEVPGCVEKMAGLAVVKVPYGNAGQGVRTITSPAELAEFMADTHRYQRFIVQSLIGNSRWSSRGTTGRLYHVGTVPNRDGNIYAADLRCMVGAGPGGFFPVAIYARRARMPLAPELASGQSSWDMLGTNLSIKRTDGGWDTDSERLLLMDAHDFNRLGIGLDDLIEGYLQTVLSVTAIDEMATDLLDDRGEFRRDRFLSLNPDQALLDELCE